MNKDTKQSKVQATKAQIIVHCLDFIENNDTKEKEEAIKKLIDYAKFYRISLRKRQTISNVKLHLRKFILNKEGYFNTLNPLYNSLLNG